MSVKRSSGVGVREVLDAITRSVRLPPPPSTLERRVRPSMEQFAALRRAATPVRLDGLVEKGPGLAKWSLSSLRERFADRVISVVPTKDGRLVADVDNGVQFGTVRFGDYVDLVERGERPPCYLAAPAHTWLPELLADFPPPEYCRYAPWLNSRFWLSAAHTSAPMHRDVAQNIFFQLVGRKRFYLYPPAATPWLYSHPLSSALPNYSRFDPEQPDYERFPLSRRVQPLEVILDPGDALYLPSRWWHQVRSLDISISLNFWWADGALSIAVRAAEFIKRARGFEIHGLEARLRRSKPGVHPAVHSLAKDSACADTTERAANVMLGA